MVLYRVRFHISGAYPRLLQPILLSNDSIARPFTRSTAKPVFYSCAFSLESCPCRSYSLSKSLSGESAPSNSIYLELSSAQLDCTVLSLLHMLNDC